MSNAPLHAAIRIAHRLTPGREFLLDDLALRQLRFRQVRVGDAFILGDLGGGYFRARLTASSARGGVAECLELLPASPESPVRLILVCAVRAAERMGGLLEAATELGAAVIAPVFTQRSLSQKSLPVERIQAWPALLLRTSKQCRRSSVPELWAPAPLTEAIRSTAWRESEVRFFLDDRSEEAGVAPGFRESAVLAVGPEGGWSDEERDLFWEVGGLPLTLCGRVIRPEHQMVAALAVLQMRPPGILETSAVAAEVAALPAGDPLFNLRSNGPD